ncbi:hypothetical protein [Acinetobacter baumannii]|uniref:hypothetical protein n=1 Tax=Acinetobacter baumannii TaxID=470 RepID=UPI001A91C9DD|nr:hypothetical protein [Acinetobacter baumannii]MBO0660858.1 hypothetical protein [Acinetobacter baumannii]
MKKIVLALLLACTGTSAYSESVYELAQAHCKKAETIASTAQTYRQLGMKASEATAKLMSVTVDMTDQEVREKEEKQIFFIVQDAYTIPVYADQTMKKKAIADFEERHYLACSQSFQKAIDNYDK